MRVLPRKDISFLDICEVAAIAGIVSVRGGIVADKEIGVGDWSVAADGGEVVDFRGGIAFGDYSWRLTGPQFQDCGFELALSAARGGLSVSLFGLPLLKIFRISAMPSCKV